MPFPWSMSPVLKRSACRLVGALAIAVGLMAQPQGAWASPPQPLTLDEAIRLALQRNPGLKGAELARGAAEAGRQAADAARWPALSVSGGYLWTSTFHGAPDFIANNSPQEFRAQLGLTIPMDGAGTLGRALDQAQADLEAAEADRAAAARQLCWNVISQYVAVLKAEQVYQISTVAQAAREAHLREGRILLKQGALSALEATRNQLDLANARLDAELASASAAVARVQLATTLGLPEGFRLATPVAAMVDRAPLEAWVDRALAQRPEAVAALARARSAQAAAQSAQAALWPQVQGVGAAGWDAADVFSANNAGLEGGVNVTAPLFDGGRLAAQARGAELLAQRARQDVAQLRETMRMDVTQLRSDELSAERQVEMAAESQRIAEEAASMARVGYRMGALSNTDYQQAQRDLVTARLRLASATLDALLAGYHLKWALGDPLP